MVTVRMLQLEVVQSHVYSKSPLCAGAMSHVASPPYVLVP